MNRHMVQLLQYIFYFFFFLNIFLGPEEKDKDVFLRQHPQTCRVMMRESRVDSMTKEETIICFVIFNTFKICNDSSIDNLDREKNDSFKE